MPIELMEEEEIIRRERAALDDGFERARRDVRGAVDARGLRIQIDPAPQQAPQQPGEVQPMNAGQARWANLVAPAADQWVNNVPIQGAQAVPAPRQWWNEGLGLPPEQAPAPVDDVGWLDNI